MSCDWLPFSDKCRYLPVIQQIKVPLQYLSQRPAHCGPLENLCWISQRLAFSDVGSGNQRLINLDLGSEQCGPTAVGVSLKGKRQKHTCHIPEMIICFWSFEHPCSDLTPKQLVITRWHVGAYWALWPEHSDFLTPYLLESNASPDSELYCSLKKQQLPSEWAEVTLSGDPWITGPGSLFHP